MWRGVSILAETVENEAFGRNSSVLELEYLRTRMALPSDPALEPTRTPLRSFSPVRLYRSDNGHHVGRFWISCEVMYDWTTSINLQRIIQLISHKVDMTRHPIIPSTNQSATNHSTYQPQGGYDMISHHPISQSICNEPFNLSATSSCGTFHTLFPPLALIAWRLSRGRPALSPCCIPTPAHRMTFYNINYASLVTLLPHVGGAVETEETKLWAVSTRTSLQPS
ncbi:hypothetical protein RRG08_062760 [Elysia crispata]|uniref:Uncharacterized protein n=1 Tax=Elysia crispata TaxID=231223 RepID=A0AAE1B3Y6_9GAST|nr:hypothetical protein RRG08_062760 [Elysia crispata]